MWAWPENSSQQPLELFATDSTPFAANLRGINSDSASKLYTLCGYEAVTSLEL